MDDSPPHPEIRASDAERDATVESLRGAAGEGRLGLEEFAERMDAALTARTRGQLDRLTADLPAPGTAVGAVAAPGRRWILGILGGGTLRGRWRVGRHCTVLNVMGGSDLDLTEATLEGVATDILVVSIMGGSTITVPDGVRVETSGFALLGGNDVHLTGAPEPAPGAPLVRVRALSLMGGSEVRRAPAG